MAALVCIIFNVLIILVCYRLNQDFFHPVRLLNTMWLLVHVMNLVLGWNANEITYLILILPSLMFSIGFFISQKWTLRIRQPITTCKDHTKYIPSSIKKTPRNILFLIVFVVFVFYLYSFVSKIGQYGGFSNWYSLRRINWDYGINEIANFKYTSTLAFLLPSVFFISLQCSKKQKDKIFFYASLIIALVWSYMRTSRTSTFTVVILLVMTQVFLLGQNNKTKTDFFISKRKRKRLFCVAVVFIVALFLYVALQKETNSYGKVSKIEFFIKSISNYTNLSSAAFVEWYKNGFKMTKGTQSFRFIFAVLNRLGIYSSEVSANSGGLFITYEGLRTNALTVAKSYIEDFGVFYMAFILMVFGIIHGSIYKNACKSGGLRQIRFAMLNAMLDIPLFYQILTNQYLNVLSGWIQYAIWICLLTSSFVWNGNWTKDEDLT